MPTVPELMKLLGTNSISSDPAIMNAINTASSVSGSDPQTLLQMIQSRSVPSLAPKSGPGATIGKLRGLSKAKQLELKNLFRKLLGTTKQAKGSPTKVNDLLTQIGNLVGAPPEGAFVGPELGLWQKSPAGLINKPPQPEVGMTDDLASIMAEGMGGRTPKFNRTARTATSAGTTTGGGSWVDDLLGMLGMGKKARGGGKLKVAVAKTVAPEVAAGSMGKFLKFLKANPTMAGLLMGVAGTAAGTGAGELAMSLAPGSPENRMFTAQQKHIEGLRGLQDPDALVAQQMIPLLMAQLQGGGGLPPGMLMPGMTPGTTNVPGEEMIGGPQ